MASPSVHSPILRSLWEPVEDDDIDLTNKATARYGPSLRWGGLGRVRKCRECSGSKAKVYVPVGEKAKHDREHAGGTAIGDPGT